MHDFVFLPVYVVTVCLVVRIVLTVVTFFLHISCMLLFLVVSPLA